MLVLAAVLAVPVAAMAQDMEALGPGGRSDASDIGPNARISPCGGGTVFDGQCIGTNQAVGYVDLLPGDTNVPSIFLVEEPALDAWQTDMTQSLTPVATGKIVYRAPVVSSGRIVYNRYTYWITVPNWTRCYWVISFCDLNRNARFDFGETWVGLRCQLCWPYIGRCPIRYMDSDGDGMPDEWEMRCGHQVNYADWVLPPWLSCCYLPYYPVALRNSMIRPYCGLNPYRNDAAGDLDGDGLSNLDEYRYGTYPDIPDTDGDGLSDGDEVHVYHTNPCRADSDSDGMPDGWEVAHGLNPLVNDANLDSDGDGWSNIDEYRYGSDPHDRNSVPSAILTINGIPERYGQPSPSYGVQTNFPTASITNTCEAQVFAGDSTNYVCRGWTGTGSVPASGTGNCVVVKFTTRTNSINWLWGAYYKLFVSGLTNGTSDVSEQWYGAGSQAVVNVHANDGYCFAGWDGNVDASHRYDNPLSLTMDGAKVLFPSFISPTASPITVSGSITYTGAAPGQVVVLLSTNQNGWATNYSAVVSTNGSFALSNVPPCTVYWLKVFMDINSNGVCDVAVATNFIVAGMVNPVFPTNDVSGLVLMLQDLDTDNDGLPDWWEMYYFRNTLRYNGNDDNDNDGMPNWWEYKYHLNPGNRADALQDPDGDGINNVEEYRAGFDPYKSDLYIDSDGDGYSNAFEYQWRSNPFDSASIPLARLSVESDTRNGGQSSPAYGVYSYPALKTVTNGVVSVVTEPFCGIRYACIGWSGYGSVPASGTGTTMTAQLTTNTSRIVWHWGQQFGLFVMGLTNGMSDISEQWYGAGSQAVVGVTADVGYCFAGWRGTVDTSHRYDNPLTLTMDGAKVLYPSFMIPTTNPVTLSGSITYTGAAPGRLVVLLSTNLYGWATNCSAVASTNGSFALSNVPPCTVYWLKVFMDINSNGVCDVAVATNFIVAGMVNPVFPTNDVSGLVLMLQDLDTDNDGLPDWWEMHYFSTLQCTAAGDFDHDGMPNGWEYKYRLNPADPADAAQDPDGDGLTNLQEYQHGTDPYNIDTDGDGLVDGYSGVVSTNVYPAGVPDPHFPGYVMGELSCGTSPTNSDTDGDGMPDGWEMRCGLNPANASDALTDRDGDGVLNLYEYQYGTNPQTKNCSMPKVVFAMAASQYLSNRVDISWCYPLGPVRCDVHFDIWRSEFLDPTRMPVKIGTVSFGLVAFDSSITQIAPNFTTTYQNNKLTCVFSDFSAVPAVPYAYGVCAVNQYGPGQLSYTNGISGGTPPVVSNVKASTGAYLSRIHLSWDKAPFDEYSPPGRSRVFRYHYDVWRSETNGPPRERLTSSRRSWNLLVDNYFDDSSLVTGKRYWYWVTRRTADSYVTDSDFGASVMGYAGQPPVPLNVHASQGLYADKIHVGWDSIPGSGITYQVWRSSDTNPIAARIVSAGLVNEYIDDYFVPSNTLYWYWISASNAMGQGRLSDPAMGCTEDSDGDGYNYQMELAWGADPLNSASVPTAILMINGAPAQCGSPCPAGYGLHSYIPFAWVTNSVLSPVDVTNGIRCVGKGWEGSGSIPGAGTGTVVIAQLTTNASGLTWLWETQHLLTVSTPAGGQVEPQPGAIWCPAGTNVTIRAMADDGFAFAGWRGNISSALSFENPLAFSVDGPVTICPVCMTQGLVTVSGTVSYSGTLQGVLQVVAATNNSSWSSPYSCVVSNEGLYAISNLPSCAKYWIKARVMAGNNPLGQYPLNYIFPTNDMSGIDISILDIDDDHNGLPDWWELLYFGHTNQSATADPDGDSLSNYFEYQYSLNPTNNADALADDDGDGIPNVYECMNGSNPRDGTSKPNPTFYVSPSPAGKDTNSGTSQSDPLRLLRAAVK